MVNSKQKGAGFEREVCKALSQWMSGGQRKDLFWRSAMSGGRATLGFRKGEKHITQGGDISAIDPMGAPLTDRYCIELKFYRDLNLAAFWVGRGTLFGFWERAKVDAEKYGKMPMLIAKQNLFPTLLIVPVESRFAFPSVVRWRSYRHDAAVMAFDDLMLAVKYPAALLSKGR
jgi:hypothetical protein